jgi:hypothetical protein
VEAYVLGWIDRSVHYQIVADLVHQQMAAEILASRDLPDQLDCLTCLQL